MKFSIIKHQTFNPSIVHFLIGFSLGVWGLRIGISASFAAEPELISAKQGTHKFNPADSSRPAISDDGMVVAFESLARLTPDDTNRNKDIYVFDRRKNLLQLMHGKDPTYSNAGAAVSGDGKALAFHSVPRPVKKNVSPSNSEIIWQKIAERGPVLLTKGSDGKPHDGEALYPSLNFDGDRILFTSNASNLTGQEKTTVRAVYVMDRSQENTVLVSRSQDNIPANRPSGYPRMSSNGEIVAFLSSATNLDSSVPTESLSTHLYLHDRRTGKNTRLDVFERDFDSNESAVQAFDMSAGGEILVFEARHRDLADPLKSVGSTDLFLYEKSDDKIKLLTKGLFAKHSRTPSVSADGRFVAFILRGEKNDKGGLVVYDRSKDEWRRAVDGVCASPVISKSGNAVAFEMKDKTTTNIYVVANPFLEENNASH